MNNSIICPSCGNVIEIASAIIEQFKKEIEEQQKLEIEQIKKDTEEKVKKELEEKNLLEITDLKKSLSEKEEKMKEYREEELKLREEKRKLQETKEEMELLMQRRLDEEKKNIEEKTTKKILEEFRLKDLEKDKIIGDLKNSLQDAQRKASQGSQQTQGEVLELDIENTLRNSFPNDEIMPVEKGIRGADIRQIIKSPRGTVCGVILWETKRTKSWTDDWTNKLKDDLRAEKADIPVIITSALPKEAENGIGLKDGVWIANYNLFLPLAISLRKNLLDVAYQKALQVNQGRKADLLYEFITGNEFRQQVESLVEVYLEMQEQLNKERISFEKNWKVREGQIRRLISNTINIYGGAQGLVGSSMPQIKGLELLEIEAKNN